MTYRLIGICLAAFALTAHGQSTSMLDSLKRVAASAEGEDRAMAYYTVGHKLLDSDLSEARLYADSALEVQRELGETPSGVAVYSLLGSYYMRKGDSDSALLFYERALTVAYEKGNTRSKAHMHNLLGSYLYHQANYEQALEQYIRSADILDSAGMEYEAAIVYNNVSGIYHQIQNDSASLYYLDRSYEAGKKAGDKGLMSATLLNKARIQYTFDQTDSAFQSLEQALELAIEAEEASTVAGSQELLGSLYFTQGERELALRFMQQARSAYRQHGDERRMITTTITLSKAYLLPPTQADSSRILLEEVQSLLEGISYPELWESYYEALSKYYEAIGDFEQALTYSAKANHLSDSIQSTESTSRLQELQTRFEASKKQREIDRLQHEAEVTHLRERILWYLLGGVILSSFFILLALRIRHAKNRELARQRELLITKDLENSQLKEAELKQELEFKERQLTTYALHLSQKNEMLERFREQLNALKSRTENDLSRDLNRIEKQVHRLTNTERDWEEFRLHFEQVNKGFFENLKKEFPELTTKELRLCALIRLNLNLKEVANILSIAPESVKTARYRLRKKFTIETQDNLTDFLMRF